MDKNIKINQTINQNIKSTNSLIQNEVIWYSDVLDSEELEKKFKNKFGKNKDKLNTEPNSNLDLNETKYKYENNNKTNNDVISDFNSDELEKKLKNKFDKNNFSNEIKINTNEILNLDETEQKLDNNNNNREQIEYILKNDISNIKNINIDENNNNNYNNSKIITILESEKLYKTIITCNKCILQCVKIDSNIFEFNIGSTPNCSAYKLFNGTLGLTHLKDIFFILDGNRYNPEIVEIYLNDDIFIKKIYSDLININNKSTNLYDITNTTLSLVSGTKIKIKIQDLKQIDSVYFNCYLEKTEKIDEKNKIKFISSSHELLYEGTNSDIILNTQYGYYDEIYIICNGIKNNIKSISLTNKDLILLENIPIQFLEHSTNSIIYSLKFTDNVFTAIKIDSENWLNIKLDLINQNVNIKIYGNKLVKY